VTVAGDRGATRRSEQRRSRRRNLRVQVEFEGADGPTCEYATTLGAEGLFIETETPWPAGSRIEVRFRLPGGERVHGLAGRVVRVQQGGSTGSATEPPGMGIQFEDCPARGQLREELEELL
jgi:uncharacterized protein (TIGR02266 family)